jgi:hypothetical protein
MSRRTASVDLAAAAPARSAAVNAPRGGGAARSRSSSLPSGDASSPPTVLRVVEGPPRRPETSASEASAASASPLANACASANTARSSSRACMRRSRSAISSCNRSSARVLAASARCHIACMESTLLTVITSCSTRAPKTSPQPHRAPAEEGVGGGGSGAGADVEATSDEGASEAPSGAGADDAPPMRDDGNDERGVGGRSCRVERAGRLETETTSRDSSSNRRVRKRSSGG